MSIRSILAYLALTVNQRQNVQLITAWQDLTRLLIKHNAAEVPVHRALCLERSVDP